MFVCQSGDPIIPKLTRGPSALRAPFKGHLGSLEEYMELGGPRRTEEDPGRREPRSGSLGAPIGAQVGNPRSTLEATKSAYIWAPRRPCMGASIGAPAWRPQGA